MGQSRPLFGLFTSFQTNITFLQQIYVRAGALVQWLWEETHVQEVVGSNSGSAQVLDGHFTYIAVKIWNVCLKRPKDKDTRAGDCPFKKHIWVLSRPIFWAAGAYKLRTSRSTQQHQPGSSKAHTCTTTSKTVHKMFWREIEEWLQLAASRFLFFYFVIELHFHSEVGIRTQIGLLVRLGTKS